MRAVLLMVLWMLLPLSVQAQESDWIPRSIDNSWPGGYWSADNTRARYWRFKRAYRIVQERRDELRERHVRELPVVRVETEPIRYRGEERRYYSSPSHVADRSPRCRPEGPVRVVGTESNTESVAVADAQRQWAATVRHDYGERYMNINIAEDFQHICDRSSTNESWAGKAVEAVGRATERATGEDAGAYRKRCVIVAIPCRERLVQDGEEDYSRRPRGRR